MRKILSFSLLAFLLLIGTNAWATITSPWSHTFSTDAKTYTADGTVALSGVNWTLAVTWANASNKDYNYDGSKGLKIGSNSKVPNSMTLSTSGISGTITGVTVNTCGRSNSTASVSVTVGSTAFTTSDSWGGSTMTEMEFTGEAKGNITISWTHTGSTKGAFYVQDITVTFEEEGSETKETATWSVSPSSATVDEGDNVVLDLTTNYDGTLSFSSDDDDIATVSYNSTTKKITVTGVVAGTTTVRATGAATTTYKSISKSIDVTVNKVFPAGTLLYEGVSGNAGGSSDGTSALATTATCLDYDKWNTFNYVYTGKTGGFKVGSKDNQGKLVTKSISLKGDATLTFKVQRYDSDNSGALTVSVTGATATGDVSVTGTADWVEKTVTLTGGEGNVVITFQTGSSNKRIRLDEIQLVQTKETATVSAYGWSTFSSEYKLDFTGKTTKAYIVTGVGAGNVLETTQVYKVPANTGLLISGSTDNIPLTTEDPDAIDFTENKMKAGAGTSVSKETGYDKYVMIAEDDKPVFALINATSATVSKGKAYLQLVAGSVSAPSIIRIVDEENNATSIDNIQATDEAVKFIQDGKLYIKRDGVTYDALGRIVR